MTTPACNSRVGHSGGRATSPTRLLPLLLLLSGLFPAPVASAQTCSSPTVIPAAGGTGPERAYSWTPTTTGTATIATCGSGTTFNTVLYIRTTCTSSSSEISCTTTAAS
jgi:hypothetical protein